MSWPSCAIYSPFCLFLIIIMFLFFLLLCSVIVICCTPCKRYTHTHKTTYFWLNLFCERQCEDSVRRFGSSMCFILRMYGSNMTIWENNARQTLIIVRLSSVAAHNLPIKRCLGFLFCCHSLIQISSLEGRDGCQWGCCRNQSRVASQTIIFCYKSFSVYFLKA